jgi:hypothetical protein
MLVANGSNYNTRLGYEQMKAILAREITNMATLNNEIVLTYRPDTPEQVRGLGLHTEIMRVFASLPFVFDVLCCRFRSCTTAASTFLTACLAWKAPTLTVSSI